ncbi:MAG: TerB family tellurite resistance protein [Candidatus Limnocylindrales bacterium]
MVLRRFLGLDDSRKATPREVIPDAAPRPAPIVPSDTATIRRIVAAMETLPDERRKFVAGFAYVLGRIAHADLTVTGAERRAMERIVVETGGLPEEQAVLVVEIARSQNDLYGGTEDYLVTREFKDRTTEDQRLALLRCCFAVGAAEGVISAEESAELNAIAKELGIDDTVLNAMRGEFTDQFEAIQKMRRLGADAKS